MVATTLVTSLAQRRIRQAAARAGVAAAVMLFDVFSSRVAAAEVSSWLYAGAGPSLLERGETSRRSPLTLQLGTGLGTSPANPVVVGGLFRMQTHFGLGTDLALLARTAMRSYVLGRWGAAVDVGPYRRWWGAGSTGGVVTASLGGPWGVTLDLSAARGTNEASHYTAVVGVDFARLTVYRTSGTGWWSNPYPPGGSREN